jgi:DNA repair protein RadC
MGKKMNQEATPGYQYEELYLVSEKRVCCISVCEHVTRKHEAINDFDAARSLLSPFFEKEAYEVVYAIAVDSSNRFLGFLKLEEGTVNMATVHLRKILTFLLCETNATGLIIAHNHPGGCNQPSREDIALTGKISSRVKDIEVRLLDHLIYIPGAFGNEPQWISMQQLGNVPA